MIAIIIPYYKKTFFRETLQSLADQTDKRFKVYIGNDASPENPDDLILEFQDKLDFEYHKFEENLGGISLVKQWERCIDLVQNEEWITILGDDDVYGNKVVEVFYKHIDEVEKHKSNVLRFATQVINENKGTISKLFTHPEIESAVDFINRKFSKQTRSSLSEHIFRKKVLLESGFTELPLGWHSDDLAILHCARKSSIYSINNATVFVRLSSESITGSDQTLEKKGLATQEFILEYISHLIAQINNETIKALNKKLEYSFFQSKSNKYLLRIMRHYIIHFEFYALTRFIIIIIRSKIYAKD